MFLLHKLLKSVNVFSLNFFFFFVNLGFFLFFYLFGNRTDFISSLFFLLLVKDSYRIFDKVIYDFLAHFAPEFSVCLFKKSSLTKKESRFFCFYSGFVFGSSLKDLVIGNSVSYLFIKVLKNVFLVVNFLIFFLFHENFFFIYYYYVSNLLLLFSFIEISILVYFALKLSFSNYKNILKLAKRKDLICKYKKKVAITFFNSMFWSTFFYGYGCLFFEVLLNLSIIILVVAMQKLPF